MATRSLNKVMLIGNIARDPELRYTPSGTAVCSFSLATNRSWMPSEGGERKEETEFHRIVAWNKLAELCAQLITKGRKVYIEGRLQTRQWETQEGDKRYSTEIVAEDMVLLDSRKMQENGEPREGTREEKPRTESGEVVFDEAAETKPEERKKEEKGVKADKKEEDSPETKEEKPKKKSKDEADDEGDIDIDDIPF